ncbi:circadian clock KaiB family protein [Rhabdochromatium marinum]|uniref:circadian clock KaiB family protein n=1 Tax=Rhabdochromatium marinum TaxID=48729 RepID=UPI0019035403|nr:circadian clock KaiB family protein [Rhabdochromatium marinum]MBK1650065.1 circadian clock protein KaiB [Rhabdochromatium marinum]
MNKYRLRLFVTGHSANSDRAVSNLRHLCEGELADLYQLEVIDVCENPQAAEAERIIATPTLIRALPPPLRRVIGDLSDREQVLLGLDLRHVEQLPPPPE